MKTELIKELIGLADEAGLYWQRWNKLITISNHVLRLNIVIDLSEVDAPAQLQAAIKKIEEL